MTVHALSTTAGKLLRCRALDAVPGVVHGFGVRGPDAAAYLDALGVCDRVLVRTNQIHGSCVHYLADDCAADHPSPFPSPLPPLKHRRARRGEGKEVLEGDAFITDRPGIVCFVRTADCVPILIADGKRAAAAAIHAGWRGTAEDVVGETLRAMREAFGTDPAGCIAAIGPRICGGCYEVGREVIDALSALALSDGFLPDPRHADLGRANEELLLRAGLDARNISVLPHCTACDRTFASWRRDRIESERQFNFIVLTG